MANFWLVKTEPTSYSIADLKKDRVTGWSGVRNYLARNTMQAMKVGDKVLVYHSNAEPSGCAGTATVAKRAYPDPTAFDRKDGHFDPKSNPEKPTWFQVDLKFGSQFVRLVSLEEIKADDQLDGVFLLTGKASRLSVQPIEKAHFDRIVALGATPAAKR